MSVVAGKPPWPMRCALAIVFSTLATYIGCGAGASTDSMSSPPPRGPDISEQFFNSGVIPHLLIEVTGTNLTLIRQNERQDVRATVREGDTVYHDVALHVKGAAGSHRPFDDPDKGPALTLNFDKFKDGQHFHGIDKLHLNNSVQDATFMTEHLCSELFREANVPSPRVAHVRLTLNGRDRGLYVLKEGFDKQFLRRWFRSPNGNLYDGGFLREITEPLERTSGVGRNTRADLKALAAAAMEPDRDVRLMRLERLLDMDRFLSFLAIEIMTAHWDGYALKRNNYRVYHDPSNDRIVFLPHGLDQMFWYPNNPVVPQMAEGLVAQAVLDTAAGKQRYRERVGTLLTNVFRAEVLTNRVNKLRNRLRPVCAQGPDDVRRFDHAVASLQDKIVQRVSFLQRAMSEPPPKPLTFGPDGTAPLTDWYFHDVSGNAELRKLTNNGVATLWIRRLDVPGRGSPSWRCSVQLEGGFYRLEGQVKTADVVALPSSRGQGAGIRISRMPRPAPANQIVGTSAWTDVTFDFPIKTGGDEVMLVCELIASAGEAWFRLDSLRLRRLPAVEFPPQLR